MTVFTSIILCVFISSALVFVSVKLNKSLPPRLRTLLFIFRGLSFFLISFLLFAPLIKWDVVVDKKPIIFLAQDNSESIKEYSKDNFDVKNWNKSFKSLSDELSDNYKVVELSFSGTPIKSSLLSNEYNQKQTNISLLFDYINKNYLGENVGALVLSSDGMVNTGGNPFWRISNLDFPVYSIAMGSDEPKPDILIQNINYNKIVYYQNDFVAEVEIEAVKFRGEVKLLVTKKGKTFFEKKISIEGDFYNKTFPVILPADAKGLLSYSFYLLTDKEEQTKTNNAKNIAIDVLESQLNILIIAATPHPDVSSMKQLLESLKKYKVNVLNPTRVKKLPNLSEYDLLITHEFPNRLSQQSDVVNKIVQSSKPTLFVVGPSTDLNELNKIQAVVKFYRSLGNQEILPMLNKDFVKFNFSDSVQNQLKYMPPLNAPFADITVSPGTDILCFQKIGSVNTKKPMIAFNLNTLTNQGIFFGVGFWKWRLSAYLQFKNHSTSRDFISKIIQILSTQNTKRKFSVTLPKRIFAEQESVFMNAELYNDSYEAINTPNVDIEIKDQEGNIYPFLFSRSERTYYLNAGAFNEGEYSYTAKAKLGERKYMERGKFLVNPLNLETLRTYANHELLASISQKTGGNMYEENQPLDSLIVDIKNNPLIVSILEKKSNYTEPIEWYWLLYVILFLFSVEWFLRKFYGEV